MEAMKADDFVRRQCCRGQMMRKSRLEDGSMHTDLHEYSGQGESGRWLIFLLNPRRTVHTLYPWTNA
jgi:hypothetical protein